MRWNSVLAVAVLACFVTGCARDVSDQVKVAKLGIKKLDKAVQTYADKKGTHPVSLSALVDEGLIQSDDLNDPWDREYQYDPAGSKHRGRKPDIWTATPDQTCTVSN
jgi:hypothetical protein